MNNMNQLFAQAKKMQENMAKAQNEAENKEVTGSAASGAVTIVLSVTGKLKSIKLDPSIVNSDDTELLEDLILAAYNDAKSQADKIYESDMKNVTGGLSVPGFF